MVMERERAIPRIVPLGHEEKWKREFSDWPKRN